MQGASLAQTTLSGVVTDSNGSRAVSITVQAPCYLKYQEGTSRAITFNCDQVKSNKGTASVADGPIMESLMAHLPDAVFLQVAGGGALRRLPLVFRTDNGTDLDYRGPWWRVYIFRPVRRSSLSAGGPFQQPLSIAIDSLTKLPAEVRVIENEATPNQKVIQTQYGNWFRQSGQWYPGSIVRLENGQQVLSFQTQQAISNSASPVTVFEP